MTRAHTFDIFNGGSTLLLSQRHNIPVSTLKSILKFIGETSISRLEHIEDIVNMCNICGISKNYVVVRLLASSLEGKALQWYKDFPYNSIIDWHGLGARICKHFEDKSDHLSLLEQ